MHSEIIHQRDRRRFPRRALETPAKLTFEDGTSQQVFLKDLSATGSRIGNLTQTPTIKPKVSRASLSLNIPELSIREEISSRIAWAHNDEIGLCFEENTLQPKLASFVLEEANDIKAFSFELTVYLKDTNAFGNTYFANYFVWQGMAREAFMQAVVEEPLLLMKAGIKLITVNAHVEYHHETILYDTVIIKVHGENMKHVSFELVFNYYDKKTSRLIAVGRQKITFADPAGHIIPVPELILKPLLRYTQSAH